MKEKIIKDDRGWIQNLPKSPEKAFLVGVYQGSAQKTICEEHLQELTQLIATYGMEQVGVAACPIRQFDAATFLGKGKLDELVSLAKTHQADVIVFDEEMTPAQQRNLQEIFALPVLDRTEIILGVFADHARTKEAKLQIELARVRYEAPRLKRLWTHLSRQQGTGGTGGSGAYLKGEGEKQIELDRRILKQKVEQLQKELCEVQTDRELRRASRQSSTIPIFAIIGYTNAGKSTLMNALTDAGVLVEDKLFATLDTTTRKFTLHNRQEILLTDTVGFIRKLPHQLVEAFKSTLEEALEADILLHVVDASHPMAEEQAATTAALLQELHADKKPMITLFNKIDALHNHFLLDKLRMSYPKNVQISALEKLGFMDLEEAMLREIDRGRELVALLIPQSDYRIVSELMKHGTILKKEFRENSIYLQVKLPPSLAGKWKEYRLESV